MEVWCLRHPGAFTIGSLADPRRRLLPWVANPGNAAMSHHTKGKKAGTHHNEQDRGKREGRGWETTMN